MKRSSCVRIAPLVGAVLGTLAYRYTIRPRLRMWGATPEEIRRPMAGDEMVPHPSTTGTRAITIAARPDDVWPWLVQIGYGRAGFYSYAWIERLMGLKDIANSDRVMPEYERLQAGDAIPMGPGPGAALPVITLEPNRQLALGGRLDGASITWAFGLYPVDDRRTRLVSRNLGFMPGWTLRRILFRPASWRTELPMRLFLDLGGFLMVRKMLSGIKQRAERFAREREAGEAALRLSSGCE